LAARKRKAPDKAGSSRFDRPGYPDLNLADRMTTAITARANRWSRSSAHHCDYAGAGEAEAALVARE
jgi:hypothetical protein